MTEDLRGTVDGGILPIDLKGAAARLATLKDVLHEVGRTPPLQPITDAVEEIATILQGVCGHLLRHEAAIEKEG